jgi:uncharacterized MAPEG superfamily protein
MSGIPILPPLAALVLHAAWVLVLVLAIGAWRMGQVFAGQKKANEFPSGTQHGSDAYWRLNRAHMNTVENLPTFAALVLGALCARCADADPRGVGFRARGFVTVYGLCRAGRLDVRDGLYSLARNGDAVAVTRGRR